MLPLAAIQEGMGAIFLNPQPSHPETVISTKRNFIWDGLSP